MSTRHVLLAIAVLGILVFVGSRLRTGAADRTTDRQRSHADALASQAEYPAAILRGTVGAAAAAAGARVRAHDGSGFRAQADAIGIPTDADGAFVLDLASLNRHCLVVEVPGHATWSRWLSVESGPENFVAVELGSVDVVGRVLDPDGEPLAGVELHIAFVGESGFEEIRTSGGTISASDGTYQLAGFLPGHYEILATVDHSPGAATADVAHTVVLELHLDAARSPLRFDVQMTRGATIAVRVLDPMGLPAADAEVLVNGGSPFTEAFLTNADGVADARGVHPGHASVRASRGQEVEREEVQLEVSAGATHAATVQLVRGGTLRTHVEYRDGSPVDASNEVLVFVFDAAGESARSYLCQPTPEGDYQRTALLPGRYVVQAQFASGPVEATVEIEPGATRSVTLREKE